MVLICTRSRGRWCASADEREWPLSWSSSAFYWLSHTEATAVHKERRPRLAMRGSLKMSDLQPRPVVNLSRASPTARLHLRERVRLSCSRPTPLFRKGG